MLQKTFVTVSANMRHCASQETATEAAKEKPPEGGFKFKPDPSPPGRQGEDAMLDVGRFGVFLPVSSCVLTTSQGR